MQTSYSTYQEKEEESGFDHGMVVKMSAVVSNTHTQPTLRLQGRFQGNQGLQESPLVLTRNPIEDTH